MKMKITLIIVCTMLSIVNFRAQYPIWTLPNNFYNLNLLQLDTLPSPGNILGTLNYDGSPALYAHNSMPDADGNLRFFIIDGKVYDKDGYLLDYFIDDDMNVDVVGYNEFSIVPFANNCNKYYIIGSYINGTNNYGTVYGVFTFEEFSPILTNSDRRGRFEQLPNGKKSIRINDLCSHLIPGLKILESPSNFHTAFTPLRPDGTRLCFILRGVI
jgi:hypothetical protein